MHAILELLRSGVGLDAGTAFSFTSCRITILTTPLARIALTVVPASTGECHGVFTVQTNNHNNYVVLVFQFQVKHCLFIKPYLVIVTARVDILG